MNTEQPGISDGKIIKSKRSKTIGKFIDALFYVWIGYILNEVVSNWKGHSVAFVVKDIRSILLSLLAFMAFGALLMAGTLPSFWTDQSSDPLWKRGLRVAASIITLSGVLISLAYFRS
jgi:hypothetical protein